MRETFMSACLYMEINEIKVAFLVHHFVCIHFTLHLQLREGSADLVKAQPLFMKLLHRLPPQKK